MADGTAGDVRKARFNVTLSIRGPGVPVFHDVMIAMSAALRDLGHATVNTGGPDPDSIDVVFGHYVAPQRFPDASVVYQLEPVSDDTLRTGHVQIDALRRNIVWDYSRHNVEQLRALGVHAHYVPIGHHSCLQRVAPAPEQDIDVLFYGVGTARRLLVLSALRRAGLHAVHACGVYADALDPIIARAKVVLNLHSHGEYRTLESVRVSYLMSNRKAVVAEVNHNDDDDELAGGIAAVPYHQLVDACVDLVRDDAARAELEAAAFAVISRRSTTEVLDRVMHTTEPLDRSPAPGILVSRLGSPEEGNNMEVVSAVNELVVARYNEPLDWVLQVPDYYRVHIYNKGGPITSAAVIERATTLVSLRNEGREADTYLTHMLEYGPGAGDFTVFTQGDPFEHSPDFMELLSRRDEWTDVQALSWCWKAQLDHPPSMLLTPERSIVPGLRVRENLFSLHNFHPVEWVDNGAENIGRHYRELHRLPEGVNICAHFFDMCDMPDIAELASHHLIGREAQGAIFAVRNHLIEKLPTRAMVRLRQAAIGPFSHGHFCERLWMHIFGEGFLLPTPHPGWTREALGL